MQSAFPSLLPACDECPRGRRGSQGGIQRPCLTFVLYVSTLQNIRDEIDRLSDRRIELWHRLSEGRDPDVATELKELDHRIEALWDEHRRVRATLRFGDRSKIVARARMEERLERAA